MNVLKACCDQRNVSKNAKSIYFHTLSWMRMNYSTHFNTLLNYKYGFVFLLKKNETNKSIRSEVTQTGSDSCEKYLLKCSSPTVSQVRSAFRSDSQAGGKKILSSGYIEIFHRCLPRQIYKPKVAQCVMSSDFLLFLEQQPTFQAGKVGELVMEAKLEKREGHLDSCPMTDSSC